MITLNLETIADKAVRTALQSLLEDLNSLPFLKANGALYEVKIKGNPSDFRYPHNQKTTPKDVFITSVKGPGTVSFNHDKFSREIISIKVTGAPTSTSETVVRFFLGTLGEG